MFDLLIIPLIAQLVIPLGLIAWLAFRRDSSRGAWVLKASVVGMYLAAIALAGLWLILPYGLVAVYIVLFSLALAHSFWRVRARTSWPKTRLAWLSVGVRGALAAAAGGFLLYVLSGQRAPSGPAVDLAFPLRSGTYYVANGGSKELVNAHLMTLRADERFGPYRGESYGVDLVKLNRWGVRARGALPSQPAAYAIFGDTIFAPCAGTVVRAVDGVGDMPPPKMDRKNMAGNHVILRCGDVWVVLGHLRQGSVCVRAGDALQVGEPLGLVGNSGNTNEPHVHIHAQRPGTAATPFGGDPLVIRFQGRYLARNARIESA